MADRVLSTEEAKSAIRDIQRIINGGLTEQLQALDVNGKTLSDPNKWDGPLAHQFRSDTWPQTKSALEKAKPNYMPLTQQANLIATHALGQGLPAGPYLPTQHRQDHKSFPDE